MEIKGIEFQILRHDEDLKSVKLEQEEMVKSYFVGFIFFKT